MKLLILFMTLVLNTTFANTISLSVPDTIRGEGQYSFLFFDVYYAKLYGEKEGDIYSKAFCLELKYLRDFKGEDIAYQSKKEMLKQGVKAELVEKYLQQMKDIFPNVKNGDAIIANFKPESGVEFYLNRKRYLGGFKDKEFSRSFMDIWLGEKSSDQKLRKKLLGDI